MMLKEDGTELVDARMYRQMIGSLMYLTVTRPDIMYAVNLASRFMESPPTQHFNTVKRIIRYIKGTVSFGILYKRGGSKRLIGYSDSDYPGDVESRRSTKGYIFFLNGGAVAWCSCRQPIVTLSTTEAEFVSAATCATQAVWMRRILEELGYQQKKGTVVYCDNMSAIKLSKNPVLHRRSKHIDVRFYFLRDLVNEGVIKLEYCNTGAQIAHLLTKPLKLEAFETLRKLMGIGEVPEVN